MKFKDKKTKNTLTKPNFRLTPEKAAEMLKRRDRFQARAKASRLAGLLK